jgi:hypothetical protein
MSIWGPTQAAWAVALFWVSVGPFARREPWAWWCIATSLLAWFLVDTPWSWIHGVWLNVGFNVAALMGVGVPLLATWRRFGGRGGVDLPPVFESNEC